MCLCSRQSLQCHFLLELGTVTPSLMYLFVLHISVLVDYTHACCATQAKGAYAGVLNSGAIILKNGTYYMQTKVWKA